LKGLVAPPLPDTQGGRTRHPRWKARRRGSSRDRGLRSKNATFTPSKYGTPETPQSRGMPLWGHRCGQQPVTQGGRTRHPRWKNPSPKVESLFSNPRYASDLARPLSVHSLIET
jgi:hypothetical protein